MSAKREKFYTVSARLVFSGAIVVILVALILGASVVINKGPVLPLLGIGATTTVPYLGTTTINSAGSPIIVVGTCSASYPFGCQNSYFNYTTGIFTVALIQKTGYNWTSVTVRFVPSGTAYSQGVPELSWSPPQAVNVTGGMLNDTPSYINIPISSGPVALGTNITGSIWAKYELNVGGHVSYANMSSAFISIRR